MAREPKRYKQPLILLPGLPINPWLPIDQINKNVYTALKDLEQRKRDVEEFPLSDTVAQDGDILVYHADTVEWEKQKGIPHAGIGTDTATANQQFTVSVSGGFDGLVIVPLQSGALNLLKVTSASGQNYLAVGVSGVTSLGVAPVHNQLLTLNPTAAQKGIVLNSPGNTAQNQFEIRSSTGLPYVLMAPSGALCINQSLAHNQRFAVSGGIVNTWFTNDSNPRSGLRGWIINKADPRDPTPHGFSFNVSGSPKWDFGMDYETEAGGGNADYVVVLDHTADNGVGGVGADLLRVCPASRSSYGVSQWNWGARTGTPVGNTYFLKMRPIAYGLGGLDISTSGAPGIVCALVQADTDVVQTGLTVGYSSLNGLTNRSMNVQQIVGASVVRNLMMMRGAASGTAATPTFTALFGSSFAIESTDDNLFLSTAPAGTNQTVIRGLQLANTGALTTANKLTVGTDALVSGGIWAVGNLRVTGNESLGGLLDVGGALNVTGIGTFSTKLCTAGSFGAGQTGTLLGQGHFQAGSAATTILLLKGAVAQTANALDIFNSGNTSQGSISASGHLKLNGTGSGLPRIQIPLAAEASANYSTVFLGSGGFAGGGTDFTGSALGTFFGINTVGSYIGDFENFEVTGSTKYKVDYLGNITSAGTLTVAGITDTGNLLLGGAFMGNASAPQLKRRAISMSIDGNLTLGSSQYDGVVLDMSSSVSLSTTRDIVLPLTDNAYWSVSNQTTGGQSLRFIGASGTGITVATTKTAIIRSNGTNIIRVTTDSDIT